MDWLIWGYGLGFTITLVLLGSRIKVNKINEDTIANVFGDAMGIVLISFLWPLWCVLLVVFLVGMVGITVGNLLRKNG